MLRFFWLIRHKRFHYNLVFIEKAQHLWRWISLRTFTRGRLVPRQPRAIKRTTRTELRDEIIVKVTWLIVKGEIVKGKQSLTPSPLLSSFRRLHEQRPMVPRRGREWLVMKMEEVILGLIRNVNVVDNKALNDLMQIIVWYAAFYSMKWRKSRGEMPQIVVWLAWNDFMVC